VEADPPPKTFIAMNAVMSNVTPDSSHPFSSSLFPTAADPTGEGNARWGYENVKGGEVGSNSEFNITCMDIKEESGSGGILPVITCELTDARERGAWEVKALIDSGSQISSMSSEIFNSIINGKDIPEELCNKVLKGVGGKWVKVSRSLTIYANCVLEDEWLDNPDDDWKYARQKRLGVTFYCVDSGFDAVLSCEAATDLKVMQYVSRFVKNSRGDDKLEQPNSTVMSMAALGKTWRAQNVLPPRSRFDDLRYDDMMQQHEGASESMEDIEVLRESLDEADVGGNTSLMTAESVPSEKSAPYRLSGESLLGQNPDPANEFDDIKAFLDHPMPNHGPRMEGLPRELVIQMQEKVNSVYKVFDDMIDPNGADVEPLHFYLKEKGILPKPGGMRHYGPIDQKIIAEECGRLLLERIIRRNPNAQYVSDVVLVRQKEKVRMAIDFARLNQYLSDLYHPLPLIADILNKLKGKKYLGRFDLRSGYHQFPLHEACRKFTAFRTHEGIFEFLRVPFGLKMAPAYFQYVMECILGEANGVCCVVYLDDIIIFGDDDNSFLNNVDVVLQKLAAHNIVLRGEKCLLSKAAEKIDILGYLVSDEGISLSKSRVQGLLDMKKPETANQLRSLCGLANYFRPFLPKLSIIMKPLTEKYCGKVLVWNDRMSAAFDELMSAVRNMEMLHFLDESKEIFIRSDASNDGVGAIVFQREILDNGVIKEKPVAIMSKAFNETERKWSTYEQEAYAVYHAIIKFQHILKGRKFIVETDHRNLKFMGSSETPKVVRWRLRLLEFDFMVEHIPGKENVVADALSRCLMVKVGCDITELCFTGRIGECSKNLINDNGTPSSIWLTIQKAHSSLAGHGGVDRTIRRLDELGERWESRENDVKAFIAGCPLCQKMAPRAKMDEGDYRSTMTDVPFRRMSIDQVGPLPIDAHGNKYILVAIDACTRVTEAKAVVDGSAGEAAKFLIEILCRYGPPEEIFSDNGSNFTSGVVRELLQLMNSQLRTTLPYRPQANGICERVNGEVLKNLRSLVVDDKDVAPRWSEALPFAVRIVNYSWHSAIDTFPARLLYGLFTNGGLAILNNTEKVSKLKDGLEISQTPDERLLRLSDLQKALLKSCHDRTIEIKRNRKAAYSKRNVKTSFKIGECVLVSYPSRPPSKLAPKWRGPLMVIDVIDENTYQLQHLNDVSRIEKMHISRLRRYNDLLDNAAEVATLDKAEDRIERVVSHYPPGRIMKSRKTKYDFEVKWQGYGDEHNLFIPYSEMKDTEALEIYLRELQMSL
jgi:hypothetical protein